jgi:hypothetical protein
MKNRPVSPIGKDVMNKVNLSESLYYYIDKENNNKCFLTEVEVIATFRTHPQVILNLLVDHRINDTPEDIEQNYLCAAVDAIGELKIELWKLSTCTYNIHHLRAKEQEKVKKFINRKNGKFFLYPHMRDVLETRQCSIDPDLASDVF